MNRHVFLQEIHQLIRPRTYVEIGVSRGHSLSRSRVPSVGIDPAYSVVAEIATSVHLARVTSDEFFARPDPLAHLPVRKIDLAFIDGMHLAEYAMRDYLSIERFTLPTSVIVLDDMLPRTINEAARHPGGAGAWAGDVYKAAAALRLLCPELVVLDVDTQPCGTVVILSPNASRRGVLPAYDAWLDTAVCPDPQDVPTEILDRTNSWDPAELLRCPGWSQLPRLRRRGRATSENVKAAFADVMTARLESARSVSDERPYHRDRVRTQTGSDGGTS